MSSRAPAARAGGSPAGDAQPRFARPFRGAAAAASLGMDAGCQTEPLPQLEPLRRLRDARGASPERRESGGEKPKPSLTDAPRRDADDVSAENLNLSEVFVRRRRRSSSVERENAALEIERVSVADFERRVAARREALVETGVLEGATRTLEERVRDDARRREKAEELRLSARLTEQKTYENPPERGSEPGAVLTPEPPSSGFPPLAGGANAFSPLVVRRRPRALETKNANEKKTATAHGRQNSLSGDGDFIAFDTTLPVPPASPSERDGRVRGPTPAGRGGMRSAHAGESGADSAMSAPASPDSPDSDDKPFSVVSSRGASPSSPSRRRGIAIAGGARGRGLSPGRRVVSPGANGTLHFGSAAPRVASRKTSALESKEPGAFLERGGGGGGGGGDDGDASRRRASPSSPSSPSSRRASLSRDVNVGPKKPKPRACVARRGVPVAAEFARGPATFSREEKSASAAHSRERGGLLGSGSPSSAEIAVDGADVRESNRSDPASVSSVSSLSRSLGSLGGLAGPKKKELARTDTSAFAVVKKKAVAPVPSRLEGIEPARARGDGAPRSAPEDGRGGSRAQKSVLTMSLRGERSP
jgi:hypothetical protein